MTGAAPTEPDDPTARTLLAHVAALGYAVSYFSLPSSLLGTVPACVEVHAVGHGQQHVAKVVDEGAEDEDYRAACLLCEMVGVRLEG